VVVNDYIEKLFWVYVCARRTCSFAIIEVYCDKKETFFDSLQKLGMSKTKH